MYVYSWDVGWRIHSSMNSREASISCSLAIACGLGFGITGWSGSQHLYVFFLGKLKATERLIGDLASRLFLFFFFE